MITKKFLKSKPICKVTFKIPKTVAPEAETVRIVGDFNDWDKNSEPMKALKNGSFTQTIDLEAGTEYQFRYLIDDQTWANEEEADKFAATPYTDAQNSVLVL